MSISYRNLIQEVLADTAGTNDLEGLAGVWPPGACPESSFVHVTGVGRTPDGKLVILTGKKPPVPPAPPVTP